jgi:cell division protein FtsQ
MSGAPSENTHPPEPEREANAGRRVERGAARVFKLGFGSLLVIAAAGLSALGSYRFAVNSPRFALQTVELVGSERLSSEQAAERGAVEVGDNLLGIDPRDVERRLVQDPWIEHARVIRRLPNTLRIELGEREVSALLAIEGKLLLLDAAGHAFKVWESGDPHDLPVISGLAVKEVARDRAAAEQRLARVAGLGRRYAELKLARKQPLQELELGPDGSVTLRIGLSGIALHLGPWVNGPEDWDRQLLRASRVLDELGKESAQPTALFLDDEARPDRVVVRMQ